MTRKTNILILFLVASHMHATNNQPRPYGNKPIVNHNINRVAPVININNQNLSKQLFLKITKTIKNSISREKIQTYIHEAFEKYQGFFQRHKLRILLASLVCGYSTILYSLTKGAAYIENNTLWSSWNHNLLLEDLLGINYHELSNNLISAIQARYMNPKNPTDFLTPLMQFLQAIKIEKKKLKFYRHLYTFLDKTYLLKLFPCKKTSFLKISERLQRLHYIENVFSFWLSQYKIKTNDLYHKWKKNGKGKK